MMRGLWLLAILAVVIGSLLPGGSPALRAISLLHINDKVQHFLAYAVLASFPAWMDSRPPPLATCLKLAAMGIVLELLQRLVPGRSCEFLDCLADLGGVLFGFAVSAALAAAYSRTRIMRTGASGGTPA